MRSPTIKARAVKRVAYARGRASSLISAIYAAGPGEASRALSAAYSTCRTPSASTRHSTPVWMSKRKPCSGEAAGGDRFGDKGKGHEIGERQPHHRGLDRRRAARGRRRRRSSLAALIDPARGGERSRALPGVAPSVIALSAGGPGVAEHHQARRTLHNAGRRTSSPRWRRDGAPSGW